MDMGHVVLAYVLAVVLFVVLLFQYMPCSGLYGISNKIECVMSDWRFPIDFVDERLDGLFRF